MRGWLIVSLLFLGGVEARSQDGHVLFAPALPAGVADVTGWEVVTGEFETTRAQGAYRFYVNPKLQGIYQLMRYRIQLLAPASSLESARSSAERVVFVRHPGSRQPLLCWEREPTGTVPAWREIRPGTDEYKLEMGMVIRVLEVHRAARARANP
ncbi:MAG: hypothetical protein LJF15_16800 [Acidobacteria bacterium]|jgi:hypothetical protein|nr:hypothetical protein [Acidobacteriota bacterium]